jgi:hypothetical protein
MQKLYGKTMDMLYKSCSVFHQESNKIGFAFLCIFYDFLWNLQESAKQHHYSRFEFSARPLKVFSDSHICPCFALKTPERSKALQLGPWPKGRRGRPEFRRAGDVLDRGRCGGGLGAHLGSICALAWGREAGGELARWSRMAAAAATWSPAGRRRFLGNA